MTEGVAEGETEGRAVVTPEIQVGSKVNKRFVGYGWFRGEVHLIEGEKYTVRFTDGTIEVRKSMYRSTHTLPL